MSQIDAYLVAGNPVAHSLSPRIHAAFAAATGESLTYDKLEVAEGAFAEAADAFRARGGRGMNITVPFKTDACRYADTLHPLARAAGAVNTLKFDGATATGYNTDGIGLVRDLTERHGWVLAGAHITVLGAGGAARGVILPLLETRPAAVLIVNRTQARAEALLADMRREIPRELARIALETAPLTLKAGDDAAISAADTRIVINATSLGLGGDARLPVDASLIEGAWCYDMSYGANAAFCRAAQSAGAEAVADGLGMLVEQAAESFWLWRGKRPATDAVFAQLRQELR